MAGSRPIEIDLGDVQREVDARVQSGAYASVSEVLCAGLRALRREEAVFDDVLRQRVQAALDDPRPSLSSDDVFAALEEEYRQDVSATSRGG